MRFRDLPGFPALFLDFVDDLASVARFLPIRPTVDSLKIHAQQAARRVPSRRPLVQALANQAKDFELGRNAQAKIEQLQNPETVVVAASQRANLLGGPLAALLKCLTAARLADELHCLGIPAVPVCWLDTTGDTLPESRSIALLDSEARVRLHAAPGFEDGLSNEACDLSLPEDIDSLFQQILESIGQKSVDPGLFAAAKRSCLPGTSFSIASGRFLAFLAQEWGLVVLDPRKMDIRSSSHEAIDEAEPSLDQTYDSLRQQEALLAGAGYSLPTEFPKNAWCEFARACLGVSRMLPVAAHIVDPLEIYSFALAGPLFYQLHRRHSLVWPRLSATIVDLRSRKTLERHGLQFADLLLGKQELLNRFGFEAYARQTMDRFDELVKDLDRQLSELAAMMLSEDGLDSTVQDARAKMLYQIKRLEERFAVAAELRRSARSRQIERACNTLMPCSDLQERRLAALQFILSYSPAILRILYEKLDIWKLEHQLIQVD